MLRGGGGLHYIWATRVVFKSAGNWSFSKLGQLSARSLGLGRITDDKATVASGTSL